MNNLEKFTNSCICMQSHITVSACNTKLLQQSSIRVCRSNSAHPCFATFFNQVFSIHACNDVDDSHDIADIHFPVLVHVALNRTGRVDGERAVLVGHLIVLRHTS